MADLHIMILNDTPGGGASIDPDRPRPADGGLADQLRIKTRPLHLAAERSGILRDLLRGKADLAAYGLLLRNLLPPYEALERGLERHRTGPVIRPFARRELYRASAIRADLEALAGPGWETALAVLPGADRYAARIGAVAAGNAVLLIAHAYVRYLGDLNGGQILKRTLGRALDLGPECLSFYDFPGIADLASFTRLYRSAFDQAGASIRAIEPLLSEADAAFRFNIEVSEEVRGATS